MACTPPQNNNEEAASDDGVTGAGDGHFSLARSATCVTTTPVAAVTIAVVPDNQATVPATAPSTASAIVRDIAVINAEPTAVTTPAATAVDNAAFTALDNVAATTAATAAVTTAALTANTAADTAATTAETIEATTAAASAAAAAAAAAADGAEATCGTAAVTAAATAVATAEPIAAVNSADLASLSLSTTAATANTTANTAFVTAASCATSAPRAAATTATSTAGTSQIEENGEAVCNSPVGECSDALSWNSDHQSSIPHPFVRVVDWSMDSSGATNKSQFVMAGIGLMVSCEIVDAFRVLFMVPGHTKFGPDLVARNIAGKYNASDVFNQCMLLNCMSSYAAAQVYDEHTLFHWKEATSGMFQSVDSITKYRYFMIVGDDGTFNPGPVVALPAELEPFPGPNAPLFADSSLRAGIKALARRSLEAIVRESLRGEVRSCLGTGALPGAPDNLMPKTVLTSRRARLFMKRRPGETVWREQPGWMLLHSLHNVNAALGKLKPYSTTPEAGKEFYGQKLKSIKTSYGRFVPPKDVPDEFELQTGGQAQGIRQRNNNSILQYFGDGEQESRDEPRLPAESDGAAVPGSSILPSPQPESGPVPLPAVRAAGSGHRWKKTRDAHVLLDIVDRHFDGVVPTSFTDLRRLADLMPVVEAGCTWDCGKLRKYALELLQKRQTN